MLWHMLIAYMRVEVLSYPLVNISRSTHQWRLSEASNKLRKPLFEVLSLWSMLVVRGTVILTSQDLMAHAPLEEVIELVTGEVLSRYEVLSPRSTDMV